MPFPLMPLVATLACLLAEPLPPIHFIQSQDQPTASLGLMRLIGVVPLAGTSRFAAAEHFRESVGRKARVKIVWIGRNFRRHFLGKVEENVGPTEIGVHRLRRSARDPAIIAGLGERHETQLAHLWRLLSDQPNGEAGPLALQGIPNVFYIRAVDGAFWAVDVVWGGAGWEIGASGIDDPRPWRGGRQILSR